MSMPSRSAPHATTPPSDPLRELVEFVSGEGRSAPSTGRRERPVEPRHSQAQDAFTSAVVGALKEVVAVLDSPEMVTFFAGAHAQGNTYTGPQIDMNRLRSLIAEEHGYRPKGRLELNRPAPAPASPASRSRPHPAR
jgi:hypothetical protein